MSLSQAHQRRHVSSCHARLSPLPSSTRLSDSRRGYFPSLSLKLGIPTCNTRKGNDKKESILSKKQLEGSDLGICHLLERCHKHHLDLLVQESGYFRLQWMLAGETRDLQVQEGSARELQPKKGGPKRQGGSEVGEPEQITQ